MHPLRKSPSISLFHHFLFIFCLLLDTLHPSQAQTTTDVASLLAFKSQIISDPFQVLDGWTGERVCFWAGVQCSQGWVTALNLTGFQLVGLLDDTVTGLVHLETLSLANNLLGGALSDGIGLLTNLTTLDLSRNRISSELPDSLGNLTQLTYLDLSDNDFFGSIPDSLGQLSSLQVLNISNNELEGLIPDTVWNLTLLLTFDMSSNLLTGGLSPYVGNLTSVEYFSVASNKLTGGLPTELGNLTSVLVLNLGPNSFNGSIPGELGNLPSLAALDLRNNQLTGSVPSELFVPCDTLQGLALFGNNLTGELPKTLEDCTRLVAVRILLNRFSGNLSAQVDFSKMTNLVVLSAGFNFFTGPVPPSLGFASNLQQILLPSNNLTGPIPGSFGNLQLLLNLDLSFNPLNTTLTGQTANISRCSELQSIYLNNALLQGAIPPNVFSNLPNLGVLELSNNSLTGSIPEDLSLCCAFLTGEVSLRLNNNGLTGTIPPSLVNGTLPLGDLWLYNNQLTGPLPEDFGANGAQMRDVRLQDNLFYGTLPAGLAESDNLEVFLIGGNKFNGSIPPNVLPPGEILQLVDISRNSFSGDLPPSLAENLTGLIQLNFSNNALTGAIPINYFLYSNLTTLDLSHNLLTGPIPEFNSSTLSANGSLLASLYLNDNSLEGPIPQNLAILDSLTTVQLQNNKLSGDLPESLGSFPRLLSLVLSNNQLTGGIPEAFGSLPLLTELSLDENSLTGTIPESIGNISTLLVLDLHQNSLSGSIPAELGNLTLLQILDLSSNQLSGVIPDSLSGLSRLNFSYFSLANNMLSGAIPLGNLSLASPDAFANNSGTPALCGAPLADCPTKKSTLSAGAIAGIAVGAVIVFALLVVLVVFAALVWLRRRRASGPDDGELVLYAPLDFPLRYRDILRATKDWSEDTLLGVGGFGSVYKATLPDGETIVAIKRLATGSSQGVDELRTEVKTLGALKHRNLVTLIGSYVSNTEALLIYEYLPGGDLDSYLFEDKKVFKDWAVRHNVILGSARAFKYLHHDVKPTVIHRDIKPPNVLLDNNMEPRVADFGLAREIDIEAHTHLSTAVSGTVGYLAPEYAQQGRLTTKSDVFAFGVLVLQVMTGKRPTDKTIGDAGLARWVSQLWAKHVAIEAIDPNLNVVEEEMGQLLGTLKLGLMCTSRNPDDRPSMAECVHLLEHLDMFDSKVVPE